MNKDPNLVPKLGLALVVAFLLYGWLVASDEATGSPLEVLGVPGSILMVVAIVGTFATIAVAAMRAHRAGSWPWFAAVILIWPLSYLYALAINRRGGP